MLTGGCVYDKWVVTSTPLDTEVPGTRTQQGSVYHKGGMAKGNWQNSPKSYLMCHLVMLPKFNTSPLCLSPF